MDLSSGLQRSVSAADRTGEMTFTPELSVEQRFAQLDRTPLPERGAPNPSDADNTTSDADNELSNQTSPTPEDEAAKAGEEAAS